ncbi:cysteine hydrolase family protein [Acinetobacter larvae]|uniref:Cysteine hydrolase n=1 Tax=Acinetobacter larvae TaxID=1789224 RepID=A0A1B2LWM7_9GAMM|nr:isochorismatase family protein [Acinetobacter larvae]AOA57348.1 cysteine hydrolase [Acinetobacter larvae]
MLYPTIRALSAAPSTKQLTPQKTALLVIDFQNEYFSGQLPIPDGAVALSKSKQIIAFADQHQIPVIHIQHLNKPDSLIFAENHHNSEFHPQIQPHPQHHVIQKNMVSVFAGSNINAILKKYAIEQLIITGLMTHMCVTAAARDAVVYGYKVIVVEDACATRHLPDSQQKIITHHELHRSAIAALQDAFAEIMSCQQLIDLPIQSSI